MSSGRVEVGQLPIERVVMDLAPCLDLAQKGDQIVALGRESVGGIVLSLDPPT